MFYLFFVCLIQREFDLLISNARSLKFLQNLPITNKILVILLTLNPC